MSIAEANDFKKDLNLLYVDTNVFIDALVERENKYGKNLSRHAGNFFYDAIRGKRRIVMSNWTIKELYKKGHSTEVLLFELIKKSMTPIIEYTDEDVEKAKQLNPDHYEDALHVLLAVKAGAECVVTRNIEDFEKSSHLIEARVPERV